MTKHCTGPCQQGRAPCPTPDACEQADDDGLETLGTVLLVGLAIVLVLILGVLLS